MTFRGDVAVIGAGPAGCSAAIYLAAQNFKVLLFDKACFPRPKPCGEGVMPVGLEILEELGILEKVEKAGRRYHGIRFTSFGGRQAEGRFPNHGHGIVIRRETLDSILLRRAAAFPNIQVLESHRAVKPVLRDGRLSAIEVEPSAEVLADFFLIADGSSSQTAGQLGLKRQYPARKRYGLRTHFKDVAGLGECVEVFLLPDGEIYMAPQPEGCALVSLLIEERAMARFAGRTQEAFMEMLLSCGSIKERLRQAERISPIIGTGPLGGRAERWKGPGWLLVGDAASSVDPITGEGISLALVNGKLAAQELIQSSMGKSYEQKRNKLIWKKNLLSKLLLETADRPLLSELVIGGLSKLPGTFDWILSVTNDKHHGGCRSAR